MRMGSGRLGRRAVVLFLLPALAAGLFVPVAAEGKTASGKVKRVVDGDTVQVTVGRRTATYHLKGVDAPELRGNAAKTCYGREARSTLRKLLRRKSAVKLRTSGRSRQAEILRGRKSINRSMVRGGHARAKSRNGSLGRKLRRDEAYARARDRGLWLVCFEGEPQGGPTEPPAAQPGDITGQAAIDQLTAELSNSDFREHRTKDGLSDAYQLHLCGDGRFRYSHNETFVSDGFSSVTITERFGNPWRVVEALVRADGSYRGARVTGTFTHKRVRSGGGDQTEAVNEPAEAVLENQNGQWYWGGRSAAHSPGAASCDPAP